MRDAILGVGKGLAETFPDVNLVVEHPSDELIEKYSCGNCMSSKESGQRVDFS